MRIKNIFSVLLASVVMLSFNACDTVQGDMDSSVVEDIKFILREDAIELNSAAIRVRHNASADVMWVYMQTEDLESDADVLIAERVENEYQFTDQIVAYQGSNKCVHLNALDAKKRYRIIVKAIDEAGKLYGQAASLIFKTRRNPDLWEVNDNWTLTRNDERTAKVITGTTELQEYENFECVSKDQESYIVLTLTKADFQNYKKAEGHKDVKRTLFEDYYADFIKTNDYKSNILKGNRTWNEERLRSGDYVVFMIGLDEDNELSGLYKQFNITVEPENPTQEYENWLGWWEISFPNGAKPWNIHIDDLDPNMWFTSVGWEPEYIVADVTNMPLKLYFSKSTGEIYFVSQEVASGDDGSVVYYYGTFPYGVYQTVLDYDNVRVANARFTNVASSEAVINGLGMNLAGVGEITFSYGLFYIRYSATSAQAVSASIPDFPWTMKKIDNLQ